MEKKQYSEPEVLEYGSIQELTFGFIGSDCDNFLGRITSGFTRECPGGGSN